MKKLISLVLLMALSLSACTPAPTPQTSGLVRAAGDLPRESTSVGSGACFGFLRI